MKYRSNDEQKEWHLCSDKQPQDPCKDYGIEDGDMYFSVSKNYLITINGKVTIGRWVRQINHGLRWQDYGEKLYEIFPTAWMPLPEPYVPDINIGNMTENPKNIQVLQEYTDWLPQYEGEWVAESKGKK